MAWESAGYGICPLFGAKAPCVNVAYDREAQKTVITITFNEILDSKNVEKLADIFYEEGKKYLTEADQVEKGDKNGNTSRS